MLAGIVVMVCSEQDNNGGNDKLFCIAVNPIAEVGFYHAELFNEQSPPLGSFVKTKLVSSFLLLCIAVCYSLRVEGQSWQLTSAPITNWNSVACSADGRQIVA